MLDVMENLLKKSCVILALFAALPALGSEHRPIPQASELVPWCKAEAEATYVARNVTPYQWTASYHESGNIFYVDGKLRVHSQDVSVRCRVARGVAENYATIEIDDPTP
jgi:hypothetical protein